MPPHGLSIDAFLQAYEARLQQSPPRTSDPIAAPTPLADVLALDELAWTREAVCIAGLVVGAPQYYGGDTDAFEQKIRGQLLSASGGSKTFWTLWQYIREVSEHWGGDWWTVLRQHDILIQQVPSHNLAFYLGKYSRVVRPITAAITEILEFRKVRREDVINVEKRYNSNNASYFGTQVWFATSASPRGTR